MAMAIIARLRCGPVMIGQMNARCRRYPKPNSAARDRSSAGMNGRVTWTMNIRTM